MGLLHYLICSTDCLLSYEKVSCYYSSTSLQCHQIHCSLFARLSCAVSITIAGVANSRSYHYWLCCRDLASWSQSSHSVPCSTCSLPAQQHWRSKSVYLVEWLTTGSMGSSLKMAVKISRHWKFSEDSHWQKQSLSCFAIIVLDDSNGFQRFIAVLVMILQAQKKHLLVSVDLQLLDSVCVGLFAAQAYDYPKLDHFLRNLSR